MLVLLLLLSLLLLLLLLLSVEDRRVMVVRKVECVGGVGSRRCRRGGDGPTSCDDDAQAAEEHRATVVWKACGGVGNR